MGKITVDSLSLHSCHTIQREAHLRCLVSKRLAGSLGFGKCATATQSPGNPNNGPLVKAAAIRRLQRSLGGGNDPMAAMSLVISQS